jgi:hypothetical protein
MIILYNTDSVLRVKLGDLNAVYALLTGSIDHHFILGNNICDDEFLSGYQPSEVVER